MWGLNLEHGYLDEVWSEKPVYFHGKVVGFYINDDLHVVYVCRSLQRSLLHIHHANLKPAKKQQELKRSI